MNMNYYIIFSDDTILEAMKKIEKNNKRFILVLENDDVIGTLTDGDIRRALINGKTLSCSVSEIANKDFECILTDAKFDEIIEKFKYKKIDFLPIVNVNGKLENILTKDKLHEILLKGETINLQQDFISDAVENYNFEIFNRPWGFYKTIFLSDFIQAKIIHVHPQQQLSLQYHNFREEHWVIIKGEGVMTIGESVKNVSPGDYIFIPKGCKHRIKNKSQQNALIISEVQLGSYFGEDDIIRIEDDYGR